MAAQVACLESVLLNRRTATQALSRARAAGIVLVVADNASNRDLAAGIVRNTSTARVSTGGGVRWLDVDADLGLHLAPPSAERLAT